jgi:hypothetical protein
MHQLFCLLLPVVLIIDGAIVECRFSWRLRLIQLSISIYCGLLLPWIGECVQLMISTGWLRWLLSVMGIMVIEFGNVIDVIAMDWWAIRLLGRLARVEKLKVLFRFFAAVSIIELGGLNGQNLRLRLIIYRKVWFCGIFIYFCLCQEFCFDVHKQCSFLFQLII